MTDRDSQIAGLGNGTALRRALAAFHDKVDEDQVTFGTGMLFIGEGRELNRLLFRSYHLKDVVLSENGDGEIDSLFITLRLTARQAAQRFGEAALGKDTREALKAGEADKEFSFLQAVMPRSERDRRRRAWRRPRCWNARRSSSAPSPRSSSGLALPTQFSL